ncbi:MAG: metal ABC transporter permease [Campylobacterales bacterium]
MGAIVVDSYLIVILTAATLIALTAGALGPYALLRRYALLSDALSHASMLGAVVGAVVGAGNLMLSALLCVIVAAGLEYLRMRGRLQADALLAALIAASLAASVTIASLGKLGTAGLMGLLFGSLATVKSDDLLPIAGVCLVVLGVMAYYYHECAKIVFDEESALVEGVAVTRINLIMISLLALFVSVAISVVGALMISALLVFSALSALQAGKDFASSIILSALLAVVGSWAGVGLSWFYPIPVGPAIVLSMAVIFGCSLLLRRRRAL